MGFISKGIVGDFGGRGRVVLVVYRERRWILGL